jgi:dihydrofolate reductase
VVPVVLGKGVPHFKNIHDKLNLKLLNTRTFRNGNVLMNYATLKGD